MRARPTRYFPAYQMVMNKFVPFLVSTFLMIQDNNDSNEKGIWQNLIDATVSDSDHKQNELEIYEANSKEIRENESKW